MKHVEIRFCRTACWVWLALAFLAGAFGATSESEFDELRLQRWVWGTGGRAAIERIKSVLIQGALEVEGRPGPALGFKLRADAEGFYCVAVASPEFGDVLEGYDGKIGWRQNRVLGAGILSTKEIIEHTHWDDVYLPLRYKELFESCQPMPDQKFDGKWYNVFEMKTFQGALEYWYQDYQTGLLHARVRPATAEFPGRTVITEEYRTVVGRVQLPTRITVYDGGSKVVFVRESILVAPEIDPRSLRPPADVKEMATSTRAILDRYVAASGGIDAAKKIKTRVTEGTVRDELSGLVQSIKVTQLSPFFILSEAEDASAGRALKGFDGKTAWAYSDVEGYRELKGGELMALLSGASLSSDLQLSDRFPFAQRLEPGVIDGHPVSRVQLANFGGIAGVYWFDDDTGHLVRLEGKAAAGALGFMDVTVDFSDFRTVDGVTMPFVITSRNPASQTKTTYSRVQHDLTVDSSIFAPRKNG